VAQTLNYEAVTGNVGVVYRVTKPFALTASLGRGWRAPTPFELFVDGVHEGTVQYLIGDSGLQNEESFNAEASARYATSWLQS